MFVRHQFTTKPLHVAIEIKVATSIMHPKQLKLFFYIFIPALFMDLYATTFTNFTRTESSPRRVSKRPQRGHRSAPRGGARVPVHVQRLVHAAGAEGPAPEAAPTARLYHAGWTAD